MKKIYIMLSILLIFLSLLTYKTIEKNKIKLKLTLKGDKIITINLGQKYQEPGYDATLNGKNVNKKGQQIALWSYKIEIEHPTKKEKMEFVCEPPNKYPWNMF